MPEQGSSSNIDPWVGVVIIIRVVVILVLWLLLFLGIFLGYFTLPILLIGLVTVIYMLTDVGIFVAIKKKRQPVKKQQAELAARLDDSEKRE